MAAANLDLAYSGGAMAALLLDQKLNPFKTCDQRGGK